MFQELPERKLSSTRRLTTVISNTSKASSSSTSRGVPCQLPADMPDALERDPELRKLEAEVQTLGQADAAISTLKEAKRRVVSFCKTLHRKVLRRYQRNGSRTGGRGRS